MNAETAALQRISAAKLWLTASSGGDVPYLSMALYGMSASYLGAFGTSIGWGLFQIFMIMTATVSGVLTSEWKRAPLRATVLMGVGLVCLTGATDLLALGNR